MKYDSRSNAYFCFTSEIIWFAFVIQQNNTFQNNKTFRSKLMSSQFTHYKSSRNNCKKKIVHETNCNEQLDFRFFLLLVSVHSLCSLFFDFALKLSFFAHFNNFSSIVCVSIRERCCCCPENFYCKCVSFSIRFIITKDHISEKKK